MKGNVFPTDSYLKSLYPIILEVATILTLGAMLILTNIPLNFSGNGQEISFAKQEIVPMEEIVQTKQPNDRHPHRGRPYRLRSPIQRL